MNNTNEKIIAMKFFNEEDGLIDKINKCFAIAGVFLTAAGVGFGVWAYFHTIHPVFEKELELQNLRNDKGLLTNEIQTLQENITTIKSAKVAVEKEIDSLSNEKISLHKQIVGLKKEVIGKEISLSQLEKSLKQASESAVLHKLQYYSDKILSGYLLSFSSGKNYDFDVVEYTKNILHTHDKKFETIYEKQAYEYVTDYVKKHEGENVSVDKIPEFAISLQFDYKIQKTRERMK